MNLTLKDVRVSELPETLGLCQTDIPRIAMAVNTATRRLIYAGGETGFAGCWRPVRYNVDRTSPYITLPRQFARMINLSVCGVGSRLHNAFFEYLPGGPGLKTNPNCCQDWCGEVAGYERANVPTMTELTATNQYLRAYITDARDVNLRLLVSGLDQNGNRIYSMDGLNNMDGFFLTLFSPFVTSAFIVTQIDSIQKDITYGDVLLKQVDATTGAEVLLARYAPNEINPSYRRYIVTGLPATCCSNPPPASQLVAVAGLAKLEYVPVSQDTDQLLIGNLDALIAECQAVRYSKLDTPNAAVLEIKSHRTAIRMLQNEQRHYEGEQELSVVVNSFDGMGINRIGALV